MSKTLACISGASRGIGRALAAAPPGEIWDLPDRGLENGSVVDLRTFSEVPAG